ncbi:MAG: hypothetical protein KHX42_13065 [Prevotella sp.]|nr:hypothetical protein [Prevotella sp.]
MISIGTRHNTCHLFLGEIAAERKRRGFCLPIGTMLDWWRQRFRPIIVPPQLHALLKGKVGGNKKRLDKVSTFGQKPFGDVDVHLVAISANHTIAVYVTVAVDEIIHIAAISLAICNYILKIEFSRFGE